MASSFRSKTSDANMAFALDYAGVLAAIPKIWQSEIVGNFTNGDNEPVPSRDISSTKKSPGDARRKIIFSPHR